MSRPYRKLSVSYALATLLALVPFAYLVRMCALRYVDVPVADAWELVPRLDHLYSGTLTLRDLWRQHNEHRPLFPIALLLTLARLTRWDTRWEIALNVAVGAGIFAVYCAYLRTAWRAHGGAPVWLVPVFSLLLFSPIQWENWMWGWQITVLLCAFASTLAAYLTANGATGGRLAGAVGCAVVATYSFAAGLLVWPAHVAGIWIAGGPRRAARLAIWIGAAAITWATFFYDFQRPGQPSMLSNFTSLAAAGRFVQYVIVYLGSPIAGTTSGFAAPAGVAVFVVFAALAVRLRALRSDPVYLFPLILGIQSVAFAVGSGLGRTWMGVSQALASRYTTLSLPLWCAAASLVILWRPAPITERHPGIVAAVKVSAIVAMLAAGFASTRPAVYTVGARSQVFMYARRGLLTGHSSTLLLQLYPKVDVIRERRLVIKRRGLSVFRPSAQPSYPLPGPE